MRFDRERYFTVLLEKTSAVFASLTDSCGLSSEYWLQTESGQNSAELWAKCEAMISINQIWMHEYLCSCRKSQEETRSSSELKQQQTLQ